MRDTPSLHTWRATRRHGRHCTRLTTLRCSLSIGAIDAVVALATDAAHPPSLPLVVYGVIADTSIGQLFAAGLIPGLIMAMSLMIMVAVYAKLRNYPRDDRFRFSAFFVSLRDALLPLFTPIIIVGGIAAEVILPANETTAGSCRGNWYARMVF